MYFGIRQGRCTQPLGFRPPFAHSNPHVSDVLREPIFASRFSAPLFQFAVREPQFAPLFQLPPKSTCTAHQPILLSRWIVGFIHNQSPFHTTNRVAATPPAPAVPPARGGFTRRKSCAGRALHRRATAPTRRANRHPHPDSAPRYSNSPRANRNSRHRTSHHRKAPGYVLGTESL